MSERSDEAVRARLSARRIFCKRIGAAIASAMAETDTSFEQISDILGWSAGEACSTLLLLLNGECPLVEHISDMAYAMGVDISVSMRPDFKSG